jgi:V/A-type H+/Na+-transporting ATPase subunit K
MVDIGTSLIGVSAAVALSVSAIAAAMAEQQIGAAAVGATAENEKLFGKVLILTVIPETIVIFGFVIAYLLIQKIVI